LTFGDGLGEAFATTVFLGVGFGLGLGVAFGFGVGLVVGFGVGVDVAVGFGVGNSISLFAAATRGSFFSGSSGLNSFGSGGGENLAGRGDSPVVGSAAAPAPPTSPNQTMLCAFDELLASTLQRISPAMTATCASAISVTFRQKRLSFDIVILTTNGHPPSRGYGVAGE